VAAAVSAAQPERLEIGGDRDPVEGDGLLDGVHAQRERAALVSGAHHDHVGVLLVVEPLPCDGPRVQVAGVGGGGVHRGPDRRLLGELDRGVGHHGAGRDLGDRDDRDRPVRVGGHQVAAVARDQGVATQVQVASACAELAGQLRRGAGHRQVRHDGAALLRQPGLVQGAYLTAVDSRRRGQHLGHGHDPGAADPGNPHPELLGANGRYRGGQVGGVQRGGQRPPPRRRDHGDERGTVTLQAGVVRVAG
jgi:hypothetical protein